MRTASLATTKAHFSAVVDDLVRTHDRLTVTRNGDPAIVMLAASDFESLIETVILAEDKREQARLEEARQSIARGDYVTADQMGEIMSARKAGRSDDRDPQ